MHANIYVDLFENKLINIQRKIQVYLDDFLEVELSTPYRIYKRRGGQEKLLFEELTALTEEAPPENTAGIYLTEEWIELLFVAYNLSAQNAIRDLLYFSFAVFAESDLLIQIARRFEKSPEQLFQEAPMESVLDWLILWMVRAYPELTRFLFGRVKYKQFNALQGQHISQAIQYWPQFVLMQLNDCLSTPQRRQVCIALANGVNIRRIANTGISFTKRMAHLFYNAPLTSKYLDACWYALVIGMGGELRLVRLFHAYFRDQIPQMSLLRRLILIFNPVAKEIVEWEFRQLIGFIRHQFDEKEETSIKGWTIASLRRRFREDRQRNYPNRVHFEMLLAKNKDNKSSWPPALYKGLQKQVDEVSYEIRELTSYEGLLRESRQLRHCVSGYLGKCLRGDASIWTLQRRIGEGKIKSMVTIEVNKGGRIVQVRSKCNMPANTFHRQLIDQWAKKEGLELIST